MCQLTMKKMTELKKDYAQMRFIVCDKIQSKLSEGLIIITIVGFFLLFCVAWA